MIKSRLIFSVIIAASLLLIFFFGKDFLLLKGEAITKFSKKEKIKMEYSSHPLKNTEIDKKSAPLKYNSDEFQAGMNVLIYGHPNMVEAKKVFEQLRSLGINSVAINFPFYQTSLQANQVTTSPINTPTIPELQEVIEKAHDVGLSVMLRPIMDEQIFLSSNRWRGQIKPEDPDAWFDSYQALLLTYAKLAQSTNIKLLNIGTELNSMQNHYNDRWVEIIEHVRYVYKGELMYSFNWDTVDEISSNEFVKLLDHVGIDIYFPLNIPDGASVEMLEKAWNEQINPFNDKLGHESIVVTEAGIIPVAGAYRTPYAWSINDGKFDQQAQANYYEATYNVWKPMIQGVYWWNVTLGQDPKEISFSPLHSPTENVIKQHFLKDYSVE